MTADELIALAHDVAAINELLAIAEVDVNRFTEAEVVRLKTVRERIVEMMWECPTDQLCAITPSMSVLYFERKYPK